MRRLALVLLAGCHFGVPALQLDESVPLDGGEDALAEPRDLSQPFDANLGDLAGADLGRVIPDGALPGQPGWPCTAANECQSGFCIDGYCCGELCDPTDPNFQCRACNVPGNEGRCVFALDGTDPRGLCDPDPQATCQHDGACDGQGSCRMWSQGTLCGPGMCQNGQVTGPPTCDGRGACVASATTGSCDPYACAADGMECATMCTQPANGCANGASCDSFGSCGKTGLGGFCIDATQCQSGFCSQNVCCNMDCSGNCRSCALPQAPGLCTFVAAGSDPLNQCTAQTRASCGLDGQCDGAGACRKWGPSTQCTFPKCSGNMSTPAQFCDGNGVCAPATPMNCGNYACNPLGGCLTQCFTNMQCVNGTKCNKNACN